MVAQVHYAIVRVVAQSFQGPEVRVVLSHCLPDRCIQIAEHTIVILEGHKCSQARPQGKWQDSPLTTDTRRK